MRIYFNPGNGLFNSIIHSEMYVDKMGIIEPHGGMTDIYISAKTCVQSLFACPGNE